jgi:hypothetical protein
MGYLQAVWAMTSVITPLAAGTMTGSLSSSAIFSLSAVCCLVVLGGTVAWVYRRQLQTSMRAVLDRAGVAA